MTDSDTNAEVAALHRDWSRAIAAGNDAEARLNCIAAVAKCCPTWLSDAVASYLEPASTARQRANASTEQTIINRMLVLLDVMGDTPEPSDGHCKRAAERLNSDGDPISWMGVKKAHQQLAKRGLDLGVFRGMRMLLGSELAK